MRQRGCRRRIWRNRLFTSVRTDMSRRPHTTYALCNLIVKEKNVSEIGRGELVTQLLSLALLSSTRLLIFFGGVLSISGYSGRFSQQSPSIMVITDHYPLKVFGVERTAISVQEERGKKAGKFPNVFGRNVRREKQTHLLLLIPRNASGENCSGEREGGGELEKSEQEEGKKKENNKFSARQSWPQEQPWSWRSGKFSHVPYG